MNRELLWKTPLDYKSCRSYRPLRPQAIRRLLPAASTSFAKFGFEAYDILPCLIGQTYDASCMHSEVRLSLSGIAPYLRPTMGAGQ